METTSSIESKSGNRKERKKRKSYPIEFKRRIALAASQVDASVSELALANGLSSSMVRKWRREQRAGLFSVDSFAKPTLLPVVLSDKPVVAT